MNKKHRSPIYFILMLIILIACTKQVGLVTEVEFDFLGGNTTEGYVNESLGTTLTVVPEEVLEGYTYNFKYSVISGEGHFEDGNGEPLASGEKHSFDPLSKSLNYIGTTVGTHTVRIQAEDTYGFTEELELTYILSEVPVTWTATIADTELLLGAQTTITVTLGNEGDGNATYERNYRATTGSGELTESNGTGVDMDGYVDITPGTYQYDFTAETLGAVGFTFDLRDSNGQELTATVNLEVVEELSSGENDIIAFTLPGQDGTATIDPETHTITVNVPMGTTLTMAPNMLTVSEGATVTPTMDTQQDFTSPVIYTVTAENGDGQEWTVTVIEEATSTDPEITLIGGDQTITVGDTYTEQGAMATDAEDGDISGDIVIDASAVDTNTAGSYQVTYNVTDSDGNMATEVIRTVTVTTNPIITLNGGDITSTVGDTYVEEGATATDVEDGDISGDIVIDASGVNTSVAGIYEVTYNVTDSEGNTATEVIRTVTVTTRPVITLNGGDITLTVGDTYVEEGATATDVEDGDISGDIVIDASAVDTDTVGSYQVTYNVTDSDGNLATEVIRTVTVNAVVNEAPTANNFTVTVEGNSTNNAIDVASEISDAENDPLTVSLQTGSPANGTATVSGTVIGYTPNNGFTGNDVINYLVDDGNNPAVSATITVTVNAVANEAPTANNFTVTVEGDSNDNLIDVDGEISDAENDPLTVSIQTGSPANGTATISGTVISYTPNNGFVGNDVITYLVDDGNNVAVSGTITVTVNAVVNQPPNALNDNYTIPNNISIVIDALDNDTDAENDPLTITAFTQPLPSNGYSLFQQDGDGFLFSPDSMFSGTVTFTYTISDGNVGNNDTATVTIIVEDANNAPNAFDDEFTWTVNGSLNGNVLENNGNGEDTDSDVGDVIFVSQVNGSEALVSQTVSGDNGGQLYILANGDLEFLPTLGEFDYLDEGETIETAVTYQISDGNGGFDTATVTITIIGVATIPVPTATFTGGTSISTTGPASGQVTISNGPMAFNIFAYGGSGGTTITFTIDGTPYSISALAGQSANIDTPSFPIGTYNYVLSGTFGGSSGNGGSVSAFIP